MNHLQHETSPYLLQHAHNPVNWYAWKPEAFERARAEQKPILVSIGYSTCHWCHVMERESFENPAVAAIMNKYFVNIKVDREERPDVDAIYMEACQMLTGGGGWPLNCFLTPDGKPFYAGTYFPPRPAHNRPSWTELLTHLADIWENKRESALDQAERLLGHISRDTPPVGQLEGDNSEKANLETIFTQMKRQFDHAEGGFGGAPKFPSTMAIRFLLEYYWHYRQPEALQHAFFSLEKMISGGIYDQVGGGFARYATDRAWLAPHFEKMLYDNALLVGVLADACKIARETPGYERYAALFEDTITETLDYVAREMTSPEGAFYSAQDADSEGVEGKFYVWDKTEIDALLGADAPDFCQYYDVSPAGNWEGHNILHRPNPGENAAETHRKFGPLRKKLLDARAKRIWPLLDTKVLFDWNALMAAAYAKAFTALGTESYRQIAVRNLDFLLNNLRKPAPDAATPPPLRHSRTQDVAFLDDYAFFLNALVDVYEITFERKYLQLAETYTDYVISAFFDPEQNLFFFTDSAQSDIILRKKDLYDNATPSGNSTMAHNLQRLGIMLDRTDYGQIADKMLDQLRPSAIQFPLSFGRWVSALVQQAEPPAEIAVVGSNALEKAVALQKKFVPHAVIAASQTQTDEIPLLAGKVANGQTLIYLCRDFACQKPVVSLEELWEMMETFK